MTRYASSLRSPFATTSSCAPSVATSDSSASLSDTHCMQYDHQCDDDSSVPLSPLRKCYLLTRINATVDDVLGSMVGDNRQKMNWRSKGVKKDVSYYVDDTVRADQYRFCCISETSARTEDIIKLFLINDDQTMLKNSRVVFKNVLTSRVHSVLKKPSREEPYNSVSLRYSSYASPKRMGGRDLSLVVATNVMPQADGSTIGYCLWDSVDIPQCRNYHKTSELVRTRMFRSGFFCHTTYGLGSDVQTKIAYLVGMEAGGTATPKFAARLLMDKFGKVLLRLCNYFRRKQLDPATFRPRCEWPSASPSLAISQRATTVAPVAKCFARRVLPKIQVDLPGVGITSVRFCFNCLGVRGLDPPKPDEIGVFARAALAVMHMSHAQGRKWFRFTDSPRLLDSSAYLSTPPR